MRLSATALALAALVTLTACDRGDEPEAASTPRPTPQRPAAADTTLGDTMGGPPQSAAAARRQAEAQRAAQQAAADQAGGQQAGGQPAGSQPAGQASGRTGGQAAPAAPTGQRLYTVQVAAFTSPDSARKWTGRLNSLELPVWTSMAELGGTTYYRVRVGAVSSVSDARRLGTLLSERFTWPVWVAPITPADRMPDDAVSSTRRVLGGN